MPTAFVAEPATWGIPIPTERKVSSEHGWPLLVTPVTAGRPTDADVRIERLLNLDEHLARIPEATFLLRVSGDALTSVDIHDGDLLVMDRALPATENSIALVLIEDQFLLTRVGRDGQGQRVLCTDLPDGRDRRLDHETVIIGVARWTIHRLWPGRNPLL